MSKYEYIKQSISNLSPHLFSPQTKISLIQFHNQARLADCKDIEQGALTRLSTELEISFSDVGTNFEAPLKLTQRLLLQDRSDPTGPSFHQPDRSLVVFLTDGRHRADEEIEPIIDSIRRLNATTLVCGIGEDYNIEKILTIAQHAGAAGWSHIPLDGGDVDPFTQLLPKFVHNLRTQEYYLKIAAEGPHNHLTAVTPSIRGAVPGRQTLHIGYEPHGVALILQHGGNPTLSFRPGHFNGDHSHKELPIEIVDAHKATHHGKRVEQAKDVVMRFLLLKALRSEEIHQLEQLVELYPQLDALLAPAISSLRQQNPALQLGQTFKNLMSQVGKLFTNSSPPRPQQSDPNRRGHEPLYNPSRVTIVTGMGRPNTTVNDYAEPRQRLAPSLSMPDYFHVLVGESKQKAQVIPLSMLQEGGSLVIGRVPLVPPGQSDCTLVQIAHDKVASVFENRFLSLRLKHLSRTHFSITRQQNTYFIIDLDSTNGTQLNGQKLHAKRTYPLNDGDTICVGDLEFVFSAPKGA